MDSKQIQKNRHILIVEDAFDLQLLLARVFTTEGYMVSKVFNGKEALDLLHTARDLPCLILLDIMMPVMDGFEFLENRNLDPILSLIPVVIMSADSTVQDRAKQIGAVGFIPKAVFDIDDLLEIASRFC